ncbi:MAG TPA: peptidoglycan DD-metalloendopeptidase family protein [Microlunatus sp.]
MSLVASIPSDFLVCPPLDYPLRLAFEGGFFGAPRFHGEPGADCCSDHFASVTPDGVAGLHQIHEAVDLASGAGACVYAAYSGTIVGKKQGSLVIDHQGTGEAYASQYLHIAPGPKEVGDRVIKGEPIASVRPHPAGDHLHFELWHWITRNPQGDTDTEAVPVDPTRLLYHWEQAVDLDYAVLGSVDAAAGAELDAEAAGATLTSAYDAAGIALPASPLISALAPGCVWRISGADIVHLLRAERGAITVIEEAYGHRTITPSSIDRLGLTRRWSYPTFLVEADGLTYGVPLHQAPDADRTLVDLLRSAVDARRRVELEIRRSAFWRMDGSLDEVAGVVTGIRLG